MNVESIRLINFRNYHSININFNENINVFVGKNAQGKTNLLEAIYMCSSGKSFRNNKDKEIINFEKKEAYIGANIKNNRFDKFVELKLDREKSKIIRINKTEIKNYKELNTGLSVVIFSPDDLKLVKDGPSERRTFLDQGISQIKPVYNYNINRYNKILFQRNNLLKSSRLNKDMTSLLDVFDVQISKIGTSIILERQKFLVELYKSCKLIHSNLTLNKEELYLKYHTNVPILSSREDIEKQYINVLKKNLNRDIEYGTTEIGPHRDDILFYINDKEVKTYGSQGQQRTLVLTLKLSEIDLIKNVIGTYPVVLLDDVFSELDEERRMYLTRSFNEMQVFITVTDAVDIKSIDNYDKTIFYIEGGKLEKRG
ncbi:DNA replication/repair protein RecF [Tissierella sp. Yu-01]|uniref:DNA replication/repair protein RecF n=1 Tax=Tissierella sp. Yu-01 TaxID=3035694 RepID=UPI00240D97B3|nr:DNA replication/repair protein RecF [Tissierella sp. Yu-01]WFA08321.1 DNA replication/repair protein RecF [Tissierella sp. Yu-01]